MANRTLEELLIDKLGASPHRGVNPLVSQVGLAAISIVPNNPNRLGLTIINLGASTVWVWLTNQVGATAGILLDAAGGSVTFQWEYDFDLVTSEWFAISAGAANAISVIETVLL